MGMNGPIGVLKKKDFDYSYGFLHQAYAHWQYPAYLYRNGVKEPVKENTVGKRACFRKYSHQAIRRGD